MYGIKAWFALSCLDPLALKHRSVAHALVSFPHDIGIVTALR